MAIHTIYPKGQEGISQVFMQMGEAGEEWKWSEEKHQRQTHSLFNSEERADLNTIVISRSQREKTYHVPT